LEEFKDHAKRCMEYAADCGWGFGDGMAEYVEKGINFSKIEDFAQN